MRFITLKTLTWTLILFVAVVVTFLVSPLVTLPTVQDAAIPPFFESRNEQTQVQNSDCDPLVIAMDAAGNVYSGRDRIGSLTNRLDLTAELKEAVALRGSQMAYAAGMDLNHEVPVSHCTDYSVFIKSAGDANDGHTLQLIRVLQEVGIHPTQVIKDKKKI